MRPLDVLQRAIRKAMKLRQNATILRARSGNRSTTEAGQIAITQSFLGRANYENTLQEATLVAICQ